jgi:DHA1 family multidrug resistance protein-like MFS transporter
LLPLLFCVAIVMLGVGITASVLPYYRLAAADAIPPSRIGIHVAALTAVYALTQLGFAPIWGSLSDRIGRRHLLVLGICGFGLSQGLFGIVTTLPILYAVRAAGGLLSAALLPSATAYVADLTADEDRGRGMAWFNLASGVGTMIGPALGGLLVRRSIHLELRRGYLHVDAFSIPFFAAAFVSVLALVVALRGLPLRAASRPVKQTPPAGVREGVAVLLGSGFVLQAGIMLFEATFTVFAERRFGYGPTEAGMVFMACGVVMLPIQFVGIAVARWIGEFLQMAVGFGLMGIGFLVLLAAAGTSGVAVAIALLGGGMAFVLPVSPSLISKKSVHGAGRALGGSSAVQSAGQVAGSMLGGLLLEWGDRLPYLAGAALMLVAALSLATRGTRIDGAART